MKRLISVLLAIILFLFSQQATAQQKDFTIKGFHLDLSIQVMKMDALKAFAKKLSEQGINTLVMEWEGTYPFENIRLSQTNMHIPKKK
jgi:uncharacterized radical SAM superfamily Fe-S cluster-containing enzyme